MSKDGNSIFFSEVRKLIIIQNLRNNSDLSLEYKFCLKKLIMCVDFMRIC